MTYDLAETAKLHRRFNLCAVIYLVCVVLMFCLRSVGLTGSASSIVVSLVLLVDLILLAIFASRLSLRFFNPGIAILLGALVLLMPFFGLLLVFVLDTKARKLLTSNGVQMGLLGARTDNR